MVVSHNGVISVISCILEGEPEDNNFESRGIKNGEVKEFIFQGKLNINLIFVFLYLTNFIQNEYIILFCIYYINVKGIEKYLTNI